MQITVFRAGPKVTDWSALCTCELGLPAGRVNEMSLGSSVEKVRIVFAATAGSVLVPVGVAVNWDDPVLLTTPVSTWSAVAAVAGLVVP